MDDRPDPFADMDAVRRASKAALPRPDAPAGKPTRRRRVAEPYAYVTAHWQNAADKVGAGQVAIALRCIQSMEKARGNHGAFRVANARMAEWNVTRWRKMRGLRRLAAGGLILLDETDQQNPSVIIIEK